MNELKSIGYTIDSLIKKNNTSKESICSALKLTDYELEKVLAGRLLLSPGDLSSLANILKVKLSEILNTDNKDFYNKKIHCRTDFSDYQNCDLILDMIDSYIDIREAL